jgi:hypothetical protein
MSALGQKQTSAAQNGMPALPPRALNGWGLAANAGDTAAAVATRVAIRIERRDSMKPLLGSFEDWLDRLIIGHSSHLCSAGSHLVYH